MNLTYFSANYIRSLAIAAILSLAMLFAFMPASVQASSGYDSPCIHRHKVIYGETLSIIAGYHGLPVRRLANANHLYSSSRIHAGQILCIPIRPVHSQSVHSQSVHSQSVHSQPVHSQPAHSQSSYGNKHAPPMHHHHHHHHPNAHHVVQSGNTPSEIAQQHWDTGYYVDHEDRIQVGH